MADKKAVKFIQRAYVFRLGRIILLTSIVISAIYGIVAAVYATKTIFKVKMNYAVVLEKLGGNRQAVTDIGWHSRLPFFTRIEQEVTLMNQTLFLGGSNEPMRIISEENVALWTSALLTYRIRDLKTWAIENLQPMTLLQGDYDGIVKDIMQAEPVDDLISGRQYVKEKIFKALKSQPINEGGPTLEEKYGIEQGQTTPDGKFIVSIARCLGSCGLAPVLVVDGNVVGKATTESTLDRMEKLLEADEPAAEPATA